MWVAFRNNYNHHVWVAIMKHDTDACGGEGGNWGTAGWWSLSPGEGKTAFWTTNQYAYYYAEAANGARWADTSGPTVYVTGDRFSSCYNIGSSAWRTVIMRQLNVGWPPSAPGTHTINLNG